MAAAATLLDLLLDRVKYGLREVTIDVDGYAEAQVTRVIDTAKARGFHVAYDGRFVLVRDLRGVPC